MRARVAKGAGFALAPILAAIFAVEGGYVNNPLDPGGETNHGITKRVAVENGYTGPMKQLTKEQAGKIYVNQYINKPGFLPIAQVDKVAAEEVVDTGVNVGTYRPSCWFQETLNHLNGRGADYPDVPVDCQIGPVTIQAFEALRKRRGAAFACQLVVKLMDAKQANYYMSLASNNSKYEAFMVGWAKARLWNIDLKRCEAVA